MNTWWDLILVILRYPLVLVWDIVIFFKRLFYNIFYGSNKTQCTYEDIVAVKYMWESLHIQSIIVLETDNQPSEKKDNIITLNKKQFDELRDLLKKNRILEYKKYIFKFRFTNLLETMADDIPLLDGEEMVIQFKDGQCFEMTAFCKSKRFDTVTQYLRNIAGM